MINLAENGVTCDCGSTRVAPARVTAGEPVICAACARTFRVDVSLTPIPWSTVEAELGEREHDLCAFNWHRNGVPLTARRVLAEHTRRRIDRLGMAGGLVVLAVLALIVRAVLS